MYGNLLTRCSRVDLVLVAHFQHRLEDQDEEVWAKRTALPNSGRNLSLAESAVHSPSLKGWAGVTSSMVWSSESNACFQPKKKGAALR